MTSCLYLVAWLSACLQKAAKNVTLSSPTNASELASPQKIRMRMLQANESRAGTDFPVKRRDYFQLVNFGYHLPLPTVITHAIALLLTTTTTCSVDGEAAFSARRVARTQERMPHPRRPLPQSSTLSLFDSRRIPASCTCQLPRCSILAQRGRQSSHCA